MSRPPFIAESLIQTYNCGSTNQELHRLRENTAGSKDTPSTELCFGPDWRAVDLTSVAEADFNVLILGIE